MPVGRALVLPPGALPHDRDLRTLLATIDAVHGDGVLPSVPIRWGIPDDGAVAAYKTSADLAHSVSLTIDSSRERWLLAAIHEVGHLLDHRGIDTSDGFASGDNLLLEAWRSAARSSEAYQWLESEFGPETYLTRYEEVWARSYAQWVATRSNDATLLRQIVQSRGTDPESPDVYRQWAPADFEPIGAAIDDLFRRLEWIN